MRKTFYSTLLSASLSLYFSSQTLNTENGNSLGTEVHGTIESNVSDLKCSWRAGYLAQSHEDLLDPRYQK